MKVGVVGAGAVGAACLSALILRQVAEEVIVIDIDQKRVAGVVTDMQYGAGLYGKTRIIAGDYAALSNAEIVMITAGVNEKTGGATDRNDPQGRLKLLGVNAKIYQDIVPNIVKAAPHAIILVITDPPDPLADVARKAAGHDRVLSAGTFIDTMRFRWHIANHFKIHPSSVNAFVAGEHGTSSVFLWSSATIGGAPLKDLLEKNSHVEALQKSIEQEVRYANITIIEGINASQYGIGMVSARIVEIILNNENSVVSIGSYQPQFGVTLSLPSVLGKNGVVRVFDQALSDIERQALIKSAEAIRSSSR